ncbi:MAG: glycosyltransferase family 2 protein, partial [Verrucomicrobia bacterium]|nr:glycosyltransferase family 2 protein [Verrucomicrobiota bacterium]
MNGVSVILCCHNSSKRLPKTLDYLSRQTFAGSLPWEVIVVDNASTDSTAEVAWETWRAIGAQADFRVVTQPVPGLSYARQKGIAESKYGNLIFCDDDNWLCPGYIQRAHEILCEHPEVALAGGWGVPEPEGTPPEWLKDFADPYGTGPQGSSAGIVGPTMTFYGAGLVVRKRDYLDLISSGF